MLLVQTISAQNVPQDGTKTGTDPYARFVLLNGPSEDVMIGGSRGASEQQRHTEGEEVDDDKIDYIEIES